MVRPYPEVVRAGRADSGAEIARAGSRRTLARMLVRRHQHLAFRDRTGRRQARPEPLPGRRNLHSLDLVSERR